MVEWDFMGLYPLVMTDLYPLIICYIAIENGPCEIDLCIIDIYER